jgi:hypothetical protein
VGGIDVTIDPVGRSPRSWLPRLLPPLVVLALAVVLVLRLAGDPDRLDSRRRLLERTATEEDAARHLEIYGDDPEDRDVAAEAFLRLGRIDRAIGAVFGNLRGPIDAARARAFAEKAIRHLGWSHPERFEEPRMLAPLALVALCDGGDEAARALMRKIARDDPVQEGIRYYLAAYQRGTKEALRPFVAGLRERPEEMFRAPAAMASMTPPGPEGDYPERAADLATLVQAVQGELRQQDRLRWSSVCLAIGRSEDPDAVAVLKGLAVRLGASANPRDHEEAALAACGLVAAGDWSEERLVLPFVDTTDPHLVISGWYAQAVVWRDVRGDPLGRDRIRRLWYGRSQPHVGDLRTSLATRLFLQDRLAGGDPLYDALVDDLTAPGARLVEQVVGHAVRLRRGRTEAIHDLLRLVREPEGLLVPESAGIAAPHAAHPSVTGMRAIYLYATPAPP